MTGVRIEKLTRQHDVDGFNCGQESLNRFLQRFAFSNQQADSSQTYVGVIDRAIVGYYTLVVSEVSYDDAPDRLKKGLARHPVPLMLLARLAVSKAWKGRGIGAGLLDATAGINRYLLNHPAAADTLLVVSSAIIDALAVFLLVSSIFGRSIRPFLGLLLLFAKARIKDAEALYREASAIEPLDAMEKLDRGWRRIVTEIGVEFMSDRALDLFRAAGQRVEEKTVFLDPDFVLAQVAKAPNDGYTLERIKKMVDAGGEQMKPRKQVAG